VLLAWHKYADGGSLNSEPVGSNKLAELAGKRGKATTSDFFKHHFKEYTVYRAACLRHGGFAERILRVLKSMNGDFTVDDTYGKAPPGEKERDE